ncbi:MAG: hypothetical protein K8T25_07940 [Planctomycetia bacterium]|nr:hypothetical protein [Planctomycetia bacterium]
MASPLMGAVEEVAVAAEDLAAEVVGAAASMAAAAEGGAALDLGGVVVGADASRAAAAEAGAASREVAAVGEAAFVAAGVHPAEAEETVSALRRGAVAP